MKLFKKQYLLMIVAAGISAVIAACGESVNAEPEIEANNRPVKLIPSGENNIYFCAFPDFGGSENEVSPERIEAFESLAEKEIAIAPFTQYWFEGITYPLEKIHIIHNEGITPLVRMQPRSVTEEYVEETVFTLENIISGTFDSELIQWAKDAKEDNIPLLVDFAVEMNGMWFPWNGYWNGGGTTDEYGDPTYPDGPEKYRDAYRHIIDIFNSEGANHITWFFHPTIYTQEPNEEWNRPKWYYPGDNYIDWIGVSVYGPLHPGLNYWDTFDETMESDNAYLKILEISDNKPFAILELGVTDNHPLGSKADWLDGAFESILANKYITFRLFTYWHENWDNDGSLTSLKINSSEDALHAFQNGIGNARFVSRAVFSE